MKLCNKELAMCFGFKIVLVLIVGFIHLCLHARSGLVMTLSCVSLTF